MSVSEHANYLLNEYGRLQFDYAAYCKPYGESLRNEARNNLEEYIAELEAEVTKSHELQDSYCERIAVLSQAVGLMTTLKPTMVMDAEHPLEMAIEVAEYVTARIAELEAAQRWIPVSEPPKVDGSYLLRTVFDEVYSSDFIAKTEMWVLRDYDSITHWMPLPEPPIVYGKVCEE